MTDAERKEKEICYLLNGSKIRDDFWDDCCLIEHVEKKDDKK